MLQQRQANLSKFFRGLWLEAFGLEVLWMCQRMLYQAWAGAVAGTVGASCIYLNVKVPVDLDGIAKQADVLGEIGKLPHIAQFL